MIVHKKKFQYSFEFLLSKGGEILPDGRIIFGRSAKIKIMNLSFSLGSNGFPENGRKGNLNISNTALRILLDDLKAELWYDPEEIELVALEMVPDLFNWSAYILNMTLRTKCLTLRLI